MNLKHLLTQIANELADDITELNIEQLKTIQVLAELSLNLLQQKRSLTEVMDYDEFAKKAEKLPFDTSRETSNATVLLKKLKIKISTTQFNKVLIKKDIMVELLNVTTGMLVKALKTNTNFGYNTIKTTENGEKYLYIRYYTDTFESLLKRVGIN
jgi:hypothetical protein